MTQQKKKNNQKVVPKSSEELGQTKPVSEVSMANEGGAKPELANQVTEASESSENDLSQEKKKLFGVGGEFFSWDSMNCWVRSHIKLLLKILVLNF